MINAIKSLDPIVSWKGWNVGGVLILEIYYWIRYIAE